MHRGRDPNFKPIPAPKRTPKPPPPVSEAPPTKEEIQAARAAVRRILTDMRWDNQGGYASRWDGKWNFVSTALGQWTPEEVDALFAFAGMTADEIDVVGDCADCANSHEGNERGYSAPCVSCLRPSHINHFVPLKDVKKRSKSR